MSDTDTDDLHQPESGGFLQGLLLGAVIGAAGFFLFGTKEGRHIKKDLQKHSRKLIRQLQEIAAQLEEKKETVSLKAELAKQEFKQLGQQAQTTAQQAQQVIGQQVQQLQERGHQIQEKTGTTASQAADQASSFTRRFFKQNGRPLG